MGVGSGRSAGNQVGIAASWSAASWFCCGQQRPPLPTPKGTLNPPLELDGPMPTSRWPNLLLVSLLFGCGRVGYYPLPSDSGTAGVGRDTGPIGTASAGGGAGVASHRRDGALPTVDASADAGTLDVAVKDAGGPSDAALPPVDAGGCATGLADCNGDPVDGCETYLATLTDCGSCGAVCDYAHASETCTSGVCTFGSCEANWDDCNASTTDGCETSLATLMDCGSCGAVCSLANATESCTTGSCEIAACEAGWGNCDRDSVNGCECSCPSTSCSGANCGLCAAECSPCTQTCSGSGCMATCLAGATCDLAASSVPQATQTCERASTCKLTCNTADDFCKQTCKDGATCELACTLADPCTLDCQGSAECLLSKCSNSVCTLRCSGSLTNCGGGIKVCNRDCP